MREPVGDGYIVHRDLDVFDRAAIVLDRLRWPLILMQQRHAADERQILHVVAPGPRLRVVEGQLPRVGIDDRDRLQEPLRVAMHGKHRVAVPPPQQPFDRLRLALHSMDSLRLRPVFIDGENKAAVQHFLVEIDGRGCQEDHHRAFDSILMGQQAPCRRVFAGAGDSQNTFGLQQLQRIGRCVRALFLHDGQYLVLQVLLAHVEE